MVTSQHTCRICDAFGNHRNFVGREMMFGTREEFAYFQCSACHCLQITDIPNDLGRFYPSDYYSLNSKDTNPSSSFLGFFLKQRFRNAIFGRGYKLNKLLSNFIDMPDLRVNSVLPVATVLQKSGISDFSASFLDVGCGSWSQWLTNLKMMGFNQLVGSDPFIDADLVAKDIVIYKRRTSEMSGAFDLITFHHSLEHIPDQKAELAAARKLMKPNGVILVRIPTVSSYAWTHYGTNWVEMDPPRHLYLHSRESIRYLGEKVGLRLYATVCDSLALEFYGSEQYLKDIPLTTKSSYWLNNDSDIFSREEIERFQNLAKQVNEQGQCGRACFFFRQE